MEKNVNRFLAILLLTVLFGIGGVTVAKSGKQLAYAAFVTYTQYLDDDSGLFDSIKARIQSLTAALNNNILGKTFFEQCNAKFQLLLGKQVLSFGQTTMVRLKTGQLYDVQADVDVTDELDKLARLNEKLAAKNIPLLYVYAHSELYEDDLLPIGVKDANNKVADDIVQGLRARGIDTLDSRDSYVNHGLTLDEAVFRTDQHWSIKTAFTVFVDAMNHLRATNALSIDPRCTDVGLFSTETLPNVHMGDVGARVGPASVEPDDFQLILPTYETHIDQRISTSKGFTERSGSFSEAVLNTELLEGDAPVNRYDTYGHHTEVVYYHNADAPEGRLLIIKDSFGTPVASFASLATRDVCALDLRKGRATIEQYVDAFKPDAVMIVHCQEMLRGKNYLFVD